MRFEWDEAKSHSNRKKHGISFGLSTEVFADPFCLTIPDLVSEGEQRFWTIGHIENVTLVLVVSAISNSPGAPII